MGLGFNLVLLCLCVLFHLERFCCWVINEEPLPVPTIENNREQEPWLRLHIVPATWQDARFRCRLEDGIIASPTTAILTSKMLNLMASHHLEERSVFTGIHALISKGYFMSMDGVPLANISLQWKRGEPNNANNDEDCLVMDGMGQLADVSCISEHPFICTRNSSRIVVNECGTTHKDYKMEPQTGSCYKFHNVARTWHQAAAACSEEGGHLAIINSFTESLVLKDLFSQHRYPTIMGAKLYIYIAFIGFWDWNQHDARGDVYGEWLTIFGESLADAGFDHWDTDGPNYESGAFCGSIDRNGLLNVADCDNKSVFICEITPK